MSDNFSAARAVQIASKTLTSDLFSEELIWLILDERYSPDDQLPRYYGSELGVLGGKTEREIRALHRFKRLWPECRVRK